MKFDLKYKMICGIFFSTFLLSSKVYASQNSTDDREKKRTKFENALQEEDLKSMEENYTKSGRDNYYIDVALEEGRDNAVKFFVQKGVAPSLFANQMARINNYTNLANQMESYTSFRNQVNIKNVYCIYDRLKKQMQWSPIIPPHARF